MKKLIAIFTLLALSIPLANFANANNRSLDNWTNSRYAAFIVDSDTGKILHQENANQLRYPASLTKMMTLYLLFESLKKGTVTMDTKFKISANAASRPQTNLSLRGGDTIRVRDAIPALVIRSANDVAVVVAENLGGTESRFAQIMTTRARQLGMTRTLFLNANGLPNPKQHSTAKDLAILGIALKKHYPQYYHFFKQKSFVYNGRTYLTHNNLVNTYAGAEGIKTGFINASGFNVVTSVKRPQGNIIGVVMGGTTSRTRDAQMAKLLDNGYSKLAMLKRQSSPEYANTKIYPVSKGYRAEGGYDRFVAQRQGGAAPTAVATSGSQVYNPPVASNTPAPAPTTTPATNYAATEPAAAPATAAAPAAPAGNLQPRTSGFAPAPLAKPRRLARYY